MQLLLCKSKQILINIKNFKFKFKNTQYRKYNLTKNRQFVKYGKRIKINEFFFSEDMEGDSSGEFLISRAYRK